MMSKLQYRGHQRTLPNAARPGYVERPALALARGPEGVNRAQHQIASTSQRATDNATKSDTACTGRCGAMWC